MATNILMPALSPTMTEGTLARWLKREGDVIKSGDVLAEIETDKATMEVEAADEGILGKILVADGTEHVAVNAPIAILVQKGESVPQAAAPMPAAPVAAAQAAVPAALSAPASTSAASQGDRVVASPLARRMAQQAGIDLHGLAGSGPGGRIVKADVEAAKNQTRNETKTAAPAAAPVAAHLVSAPAPAPKPVVITAPHSVIPNSSMRKVIARRLSEAKATVPHFYVSIDVEIDALLKLRAELNAKSPAGAGAFKLSVNDLVIKAAAAALRRVPKVNASYTEDATILYHDVDISVAVSIEEGLITPIIRHADKKGLAAISAEMKDLAARAKSGKLKPEEFQGGGFSISNMGMYGVSTFAAIINPPQAAILAVAAGQQRAVVKQGQLAIATVMTCTLSVDHRVVDGALGAEWLAAFKQIVEDPLSLML
jgi:pyruvate dehydrogenase E2 component (dihydrolipoamide acetyltransferase)